MFNSLPCVKKEINDDIVRYSFNANNINVYACLLLLQQLCVPTSIYVYFYRHNHIDQKMRNPNTAHICVVINERKYKIEEIEKAAKKNSLSHTSNGYHTRLYIVVYINDKRPQHRHEITRSQLLMENYATEYYSKTIKSQLQFMKEKFPATEFSMRAYLNFFCIFFHFPFICCSIRL